MQAPENQPIGFWTTRAGEAISERTRGALAQIGVTQAEWWIVHQLSLHADGMERTAMVETIGPNQTPATIERAIASAAAKGWVAQDGTVLRPTRLGTAWFERAASVQDALHQERMAGIGQDEYATTITVLQRVIENVGGHAWHW